MENRKRARFEMINLNSNNSSEIIQGVASAANNLGTATLATIGGQSFIFNNSSSTQIPTNILLSICDGIKDESEEYILDHSLVAPVKQKQVISNQTINKTNLAGPQYRIINQAGKVLTTTSLNTTVINNSAVNAKNSILPSGLNFPPGCEIYVVKEVFDTPGKVIAETSTTCNINPKAVCGNGTTIKLGNVASSPLQRHTIVNGSKRQNLISNPTIAINNTSPVTSTSNSLDDPAKRSLILEAYKKRDDNRRAIHNEVERRRRNKMNSLIYKLKEMLPSDVTSSNINNSSSPTSINQNNLTNSASTTRTPSHDSKSQILIKACEYIKSLNKEISSLRECLTENEHLRLQNEQLQDEIDTLRAQQHKINNNCNILLTTNSNGTINNSDHNSDNSDCEITLNSLNTTYADVQLFSPSTSQHNNHHLTDLVGLTNSNDTSTPNSVNLTYAKRKLIITDYVD